MDKIDPNAFLDWMADMDHFFKWHSMSEGRRVRFAKMKLIGLTKLCWTNLELQLKRTGEVSIVDWFEMKDKPKEKHLPLPYKSRLLDQWKTLR